MGTVVVRERERRPDGTFAVRIAFEDGVEYDVDLRDPADGQDERLFSWYFEEHLRYPFLDKEAERAAKKRIEQYGQKLFQQLFTGRAEYDYRRMRERGFDSCRVEVSGSAAFQRLHWETLWDPELPSPLAIRLPVTRRVEPLSSRFEAASDRATLNILVVTARPDGPSDVGFRTLSRPLLDALRQAAVPVTVDLVRPGTWDALRGHLDATRAEHGGGWYHVVHFDLHGLFTTQDKLKTAHEAGQFFLRRRSEEFDGEQGFLFFETAQDGTAEPVPAADVASLLAEHRVPVAVLSACQSAMQNGDEASLAFRLVQAGVPLTVGMAYSVTVSAAAQAIPALYRRLAEKADPVAAVHAARRRLFDEPARHAYFNEELDLEDWMLPVLYRQRPIDLRLREMTEPEAQRFYARQVTVADEPATEYGFVGRDLDVQTIERRLLLDDTHNQLLVRGMAGAGKSTLLTHLGWWWQRTGLVDHVFHFSYEDQAWTTAQIIRDIGKQLLTPVDQAKLDALSDDAQLERVAGMLRARRHLLVVDNAESITASPASIPHALPAAEQQRLRTLLGRLRGGRTLVLIGSREAEEWLAPGTFTDSVYELPGLDPQAARDLVDRILTCHGATHYKDDPDQREALDQIIDLLGGYPLPLTIVLPALAETTPTTVLEDLTTGGQEAGPVGLARLAIEASHGKLDPTLQQSLLLLAPFVATAPTSLNLERYQEILTGYPAVTALGAVDLTAAVDHAVRVGLATAHPQLSGTVQLQPVLPYFLRNRIRGHPNLAAAAADAHYQYHCELGATAQQLLTSNTAEDRTLGRTVTATIYANLQAAVTHALTTAQPVLPALIPLEEYLDQAQQYHPRWQLLTRAIDNYPTPDTTARQHELAQLHHLAGIVAQKKRQFDDAETHYRRALDLLLKFGDEHSATITYHNLGVVAQEQRRFDDATTRYQHALDLFKKFGDEHGAARVYHQLGRVAQEQRRFDDANAHYQRSLDLFKKFGDEHSAASVYHQLGMVAQGQRRFDDANAHYQHALDLKLKFGDEHSATITHHQLGMVAQEQHRFDDATTHLRRALDLALKFGNEHSAASVYHQLGVVAQGQRRFDDATTHYQRSLDLELKLGNEHGTASTYHQLGMVAQEQHRFDDATTHYRRALDLALKFGNEHSAAITHHQLGIVAQEQHRFDDATTHYQHALDLKLKLGNEHSAAITHHQLGIVAQEQHRFDDATTHYRRALDLFEKTNNARFASISATSMGKFLIEVGKHVEAVGALLYAATSWHEMYDVWPPEDLGWLKRARRHLTGDEYNTALRTHAPADLAEEIRAEIDRAEELDNES